jgi:hypothetical protein
MYSLRVAGKLKAKTPTPSASGEDDHGAKTRTPRKKASTVHSTRSSLAQKANLEAIDSRRCLISNRRRPTAIIQACHILRRKTTQVKVRLFRDVLHNMHINDWFQWARWDHIKLCGTS